MKVFYFIAPVFVLLSFFVCCNTGLKLPSYIKPCKKSDPREVLNRCAKEHGQEVIPTIAKGDPKYNVPVLDPLHIDQIIVTATPTDSLVLSNLSVSGIKDTKIEKMDINLDKLTLNMTLSNKLIFIKGDYDAKGHIQAFQLEGRGPVEIQAVDGLYHTFVQFGLVERDGKHWGELKNIKVHFTLGNANINLENLINEELGKNVNKFINDNWKGLLEIIRNPIHDTIVQIAKRILDGVFAKVEYENLFN